MKVNSFKKSVLLGIIWAVLTFAAYIGFTYLIHFLTGGQPFITKSETADVINGIPFVPVNIIGGALSAIIPILLLRYSSEDKFESCVFISAACYILLFILVFSNLFMFRNPIIYDSPLNSFDALKYGIITFPIGSIVGMIITIIIGLISNSRRKKDI